MNKDELRGAVHNLKGRVKEAFGNLTGDKKAAAEGTIERARGAVEKKVGEVKSALEDDESESIEEEINEE